MSPAHGSTWSLGLSLGLIVWNLIKPLWIFKPVPAIHGQVEFGWPFPELPGQGGLAMAFSSLSYLEEAMVPSWKVLTLWDCEQGKNPHFNCHYFWHSQGNCWQPPKVWCIKHVGSPLGEGSGVWPWLGRKSLYLRELQLHLSCTSAWTPWAVEMQTSKLIPKPSHLPWATAQAGWGPALRNDRIIKAGKDLLDHGIQPLTQHHPIHH